MEPTVVTSPHSGTAAPRPGHEHRVQAQRVIRKDRRPNVSRTTPLPWVGRCSSSRSASGAVPVDPSELKSRTGASYATLLDVTGLKIIGYARVSTTAQDLTAERDGLAALGVDLDRVYVDHGLTGTTRARPEPREALAACRTGDTLVVTKLDRLARSCPTPWTTSTSSPPAASFSSSAAPCTTRPTRSGRATEPSRSRGAKRDGEPVQAIFGIHRSSGANTRTA